jgi:hypothetical protein
MVFLAITVDLDVLCSLHKLFRGNPRGWMLPYESNLIGAPTHLRVTRLSQEKIKISDPTFT